MKIEETYSPDRRVVIYPAYIDKTKTEREGRKIPKERCVEGPLFLEIFLACSKLKLAAEYEKKCYPRGNAMELGRVRVQLKNDLGQPIVDEIPDRRTLFLRVADEIAKDPARIKRGGKPPVLVMTPEGPRMLEPKEAERLQQLAAKEAQLQAQQAMAQMGGMGGMGAMGAPPGMKKMIKTVKKK